MPADWGVLLSDCVFRCFIEREGGEAFWDRDDLLGVGWGLDNHWRFFLKWIYLLEVFSISEQQAAAAIHQDVVLPVVQLLDHSAGS